ncbi:hypothetical protein VP01_2539g2 [Puccinia sorghi]|uniref:Uncharacterized protein n=1 Tax=Puccinia sorghi TaxID=27349 RepID=A0A0L6V5F4_9BASI|nr:hypothetical protein VP01_2539g2 [Puccinia sorghi]
MTEVMTSVVSFDFSPRQSLESFVGYPKGLCNVNLFLVILKDFFLIRLLTSPLIVWRWVSIDLKSASYGFLASRLHVIPTHIRNGRPCLMMSSFEILILHIIRNNQVEKKINTYLYDDLRAEKNLAGSIPAIRGLTSLVWVLTQNYACTCTSQNPDSFLDMHIVIFYSFYSHRTHRYKQLPHWFSHSFSAEPFQKRTKAFFAPISCPLIQVTESQLQLEPRCQHGNQKKYNKRERKKKGKRKEKEKDQDREESAKYETQTPASSSIPHRPPAMQMAWLVNTCHVFSPPTLFAFLFYSHLLWIFFLIVSGKQKEASKKDLIASMKKYISKE